MHVKFYVFGALKSHSSKKAVCTSLASPSSTFPSKRRNSHCQNLSSCCYFGSRSKFESAALQSLMNDFWAEPPPPEYLWMPSILAGKIIEGGSRPRSGTDRFRLFAVDKKRLWTATSSANYSYESGSRRNYSYTTSWDLFDELKYVAKDLRGVS